MPLISSINRLQGVELPCVSLHEDRHVLGVGGRAKHTHYFAVVLHDMQHLTSHCSITISEQGHEQRNIVYQLDMRTYLVYASRQFSLRVQNKQVTLCFMCIINTY